MGKHTLKNAEMYPQLFGENVKRKRKELGMSGEQLAIKSGYKERSSICKIEKGQTAAPLEQRLRIAETLGVPLRELEGDSTEASGRIAETMTEMIHKEVATAVAYENMCKEILSVLEKYKCLLSPPATSGTECPLEPSQSRCNSR